MVTRAVNRWPRHRSRTTVLDGVPTVTILSSATVVRPLRLPGPAAGTPGRGGPPGCFTWNIPSTRLGRHGFSRRCRAVPDHGCATAPSASSARRAPAPSTGAPRPCLPRPRSGPAAAVAATGAGWPTPSSWPGRSAHRPAATPDGRARRPPPRPGWPTGRTPGRGRADSPTRARRPTGRPTDRGAVDHGRRDGPPTSLGSGAAGSLRPTGGCGRSPGSEPGPGPPPAPPGRDRIRAGRARGPPRDRRLRRVPPPHSSRGSRGGDPCWSVTCAGDTPQSYPQNPQSYPQMWVDHAPRCRPIELDVARVDLAPPPSGRSGVPRRCHPARRTSPSRTS